MRMHKLIFLVALGMLAGCVSIQVSAPIQSPQGKASNSTKADQDASGNTADVQAGLNTGKGGAGLGTAAAEALKSAVK